MAVAGRRWLAAGLIGCCGLLVSEMGGALRPANAQQSDDFGGGIDRKSDQAAEKPADATGGRSPTPADPQGAAVLLQQAHERLIQHKSIQARLDQWIYLPRQTLHATGTYASTADLKLRLAYEVQLPGADPSRLLEVSDGAVLWTQTEIQESNRITRRDLRQILNAIATGTGSPQTLLTGELALGGLPALLASIRRSMDLTDVREIKGELVVTAAWNKATRDKLSGGRPELPGYVPDRLKIGFNPETLVPNWLNYQKRAPGKPGTYRPLLRIQFSDVVLDGELGEELFRFSPPDGVAVEDVTRQYLEMIQSAGKTSESEPAGGIPGFAPAPQLEKAGRSR